ncbi:phosphoribosylamine--glycine ligase [Vibrio splendidus]
MKSDHTILSLDPMYSPLHEEIGKITGDKKYAITSCFAKKVYLPNFEQVLAVSLIDSVSKEEAKPYQDKIASMETYHHAYVKKVELRSLDEEELNYMARFYVALKRFIVKKSISLVIVHNDSRWYHFIAIDICCELNIPYLVTEQGLIRPYTTVIDPQGCNARSKIIFDDIYESTSDLKSTDSEFNPKSKHDSLKSMLFFLFFLLIFTIERINKSKTIVRYMHNDYRVSKYTKRIWNKICVKKKNNCQQVLENSVLLLLQLETDSQFLLYSPFQSNQQLIDLVSVLAKDIHCHLAIKSHPLDRNMYSIDSSSYFVEGNIKTLSESAKAVFTINSSASVEVMKTNTPLILLGDSIYWREGVADKLNILSAKVKLNISNLKVDQLKRECFLNYLRDDYLVHGAGYSFCPEHLKNKLEKILD